jgi:uncharacterized membrane protein
MSVLQDIQTLRQKIRRKTESGEYFFANLTTINGYWDFSIPEYYNTALSVVILAPIYSTYKVNPKRIMKEVINGVFRKNFNS